MHVEKTGPIEKAHVLSYSKRSDLVLRASFEEKAVLLLPYF
jgi:hypothetical protein